jgi:hypothetical protein
MLSIRLLSDFWTQLWLVGRYCNTAGPVWIDSCDWIRSWSLKRPVVREALRRTVVGLHSVGQFASGCSGLDTELGNCWRLLAELKKKGSDRLYAARIKRSSSPYLTVTDMECPPIYRKIVLSC